MDFQRENAADQAMASLVGRIRLGCRTYAVSLIWSPLDADGGSLREQARAAAERTEAELIALRPGGDLCPDQYALGDCSLGQKPGMPALAASVAGKQSGALHAVWPLAAGVWWLLSLRDDGSILYDYASRDENEIRELFKQSLAVQPWDQMICPETWGISGSQPAEQNAPMRACTPVKLRAVRLDRARLALWGGCILGLAAMGLSVQLWWPDAVDQAPVAQPSQPPPPAPWLGQPQAGAALQACAKALLAYAPEAAGIAGWMPTQGRCDGGQVRYSLQRQGGLDHWLAPMAAKLKGKPTVQSGETDQASLAWSLQALPVWPAKSAGNADLSAIQARLKIEFAELGMPARFEPIAGAWPGLRLTLSLGRQPQLLLPLLAPLPATLIREVGHDIEKHDWTLVAEIYGNHAPG